GGSARLWPRGPESATFRFAVLAHQQHGRAELTAQGETLDQAKTDEQEGRRDTDVGVRRQQADGRRRRAEQQERHDQHGFAAEPVTEVTEDDTAEGTGEEAEPLSRQSHQQTGDTAVAGEEQRPEDHGRQYAVDGEVVPLQNG